MILLGLGMFFLWLIMICPILLLWWSFHLGLLSESSPEWEWIWTMAGNLLHPVNDSSGSHSHAVDGRPVHIRLPSISGRLHQRSAVAAFMNALHWDALPELHKMHCTLGCTVLGCSRLSERCLQCARYPIRLLPPHKTNSSHTICSQGERGQLCARQLGWDLGMLNNDE